MFVLEFDKVKSFLRKLFQHVLKQNCLKNLKTVHVAVKEVVLTSVHVLRNLGILFNYILSFCKRFYSSRAQMDEHTSGS